MFGSPVQVRLHGALLLKVFGYSVTYVGPPDAATFDVVKRPMAPFIYIDDCSAGVDSFVVHVSTLAHGYRLAVVLCGTPPPDGEPRVSLCVMRVTYCTPLRRLEPVVLQDSKSLGTAASPPSLHSPEHSCVLVDEVPHRVCFHRFVPVPLIKLPPRVLTLDAVSVLPAHFCSFRLVLHHFSTTNALCYTKTLSVQ